MKVMFSEGRGQSAKATHEEARDFRKLARELVSMESGVLPQASYLGSLFQQKILFLKPVAIADCNRIVVEVEKLRPIIIFRTVHTSSAASDVVTFSDAFFNDRKIKSMYKLERILELGIETG